MGLTLVTAPPANPLSLEEAKAHLRVDHTDEDDLIEIYIKAATDYIDGRSGFLGRCIVRQTWRLVIDGFHDNEIKIPLPPLRSVNSVKYDDADGAEAIIRHGRALAVRGRIGQVAVGNVVAVRIGPRPSGVDDGGLRGVHVLRNFELYADDVNKPRKRCSPVTSPVSGSNFRTPT